MGKVSFVAKLLIKFVETIKEHKSQFFPQLLETQPLLSKTGLLSILNLDGDKISFKFLPLLAAQNKLSLGNKI